MAPTDDHQAENPYRAPGEQPSPPLASEWADTATSVLVGVLIVLGTLIGVVFIIYPGAVVP